MFNPAKPITLAILCGTLMMSSLTPARAFRLVEPVAEAVASSGQAPVAAFATGASEAADASTALSPEEIRHVEWCARRYMSYHAVDDTFLAASGVRAACRSPR